MKEKGRGNRRRRRGRSGQGGGHKSQSTVSDTTTDYRLCGALVQGSRPLSKALLRYQVYSHVSLADMTIYNMTVFSCNLN